MYSRNFQKALEKAKRRVEREKKKVNKGRKKLKKREPSFSNGLIYPIN